MSAEEVLRSNESKALSGSQFVSSVAGKGKGKMKGGKKAKAIGAGVFIVGMLAIPMFIFGFGNFAPVALSERLVEETDVQYADGVQSKQLVFQEALKEGKVPENTAARLKENGVIVGNVDASGNFVESADGKSVKVGDKIVSADNFYAEVNNNVTLYSAFNNATYDRAAYYYDEYAQDTFNDLGVTRNSYNSDSDFEEVMSNMVGEGSNITINDVGEKSKEKKDDKGNTVKDKDGKTVYETYEDYLHSTGAESKDAAGEFVEQVGERSKSSSKDQATIDAASSLETADTISRQQRSSKFYIGIMENISKMKAGEGSETKLNEAMNYLYRDEESEVVDTTTGEVIPVKGSAMESPSLFAVLSGENINADDIKNYNTERVTNTIQNQLQGDYNIDQSYTGTVTSSSTSSLDASIGRYVANNTAADTEALGKVTPIIDSSLVNNSFDTIKGVAAGELLVEGAVNTSAALALASGATVGNNDAVNKYAKLTNTVLAMDAEADRLNRSPLDITSKNTFLGALVRKFAVETIRSGSFLNQVASFAKVTANAATSLISAVRADEENTSYMKPYSGCERFNNIGAVATIGCSRNETFDTSTLKSNIFDDAGYQAFLSKNIDENNKVVEDSVLAKFILYNNKRQTPVGVTDGGILDTLENKNTGDGSGKIPYIRTFTEKIFAWMKSLFGLDKPKEENVNIASGQAFVNDPANNPYWNGKEGDGSDSYKYAQRYISLARAKSSLRQYDGGENAYVDIPGLGGKEDPVMAFIKEHKESQDSIASND